jgi:predicted transcriptional regulator
MVFCRFDREHQNARRNTLRADQSRTGYKNHRRLCSAQPIAPDQLATLISTVHQALSGLGKAAAEIEVERTPAVPIRRSVHHDYIVCLECGWRGQMLRRHLATDHGLTVEQYRARWNLSREHPLTAPSYSERRSGLAKQLGLGRGRRRSREEPEPVEPETPAAAQPRSRRGGRPPATAT